MNQGLTLGWEWCNARVAVRASAGLEELLVLRSPSAAGLLPSSLYLRNQHAGCGLLLVGGWGATC